MGAHVPALGRLIVIGGGCYGHHHATRLLAAQGRGRLAFDQLVVVDRNADHRVRQTLGDRPDVRYVVSDWSTFLREHLAEAEAADDHIVPAPLAPHLLASWLEGALKKDLPGREVRWERVSHTFEQPFARHGADGAFYFSFADWTCPVTCTEPARCPAIRAPRTWEQAAFLEAFVAEREAVAGLATFVCRLRTGGIGTVGVRELLDARSRLGAIARANPAAPQTFLVATVSACHGAMGQIRVGPEPAHLA